MSSTKFRNLDFSPERLQELIGNRTQREFAEWIGESPSTVTEWMKGRNRPGWNFLAKLSEKGVNVNWFLTGEGPMHIEADPQAGGLPANLQHLLHELDGWPTLVDDVLRLVRLKKQEYELQEELKAVFKKSKKK